MKKYNLIGMVTFLALGYAIFIYSCQDDELLSLGPKFDMEEGTLLTSDAAATSTLIVPPGSVPYGKTFKQWTVEWWQYVMSFECQRNPLNDATGVNALIGQSGPVVFLVGTTGGVATRTVTIARDKAIFFPLINIINDYPCSEATFKPAPKQSIEDFLKQGADKFIDLARNLEVTLDGTIIKVTDSSRYATDLFYFTGNRDLINCFDPCVTGYAQAAVSDGYWVMLKQLKPGIHKLHFHAEIINNGFIVDVTYLITVR